jgi:hypothetical protein
MAKKIKIDFDFKKIVDGLNRFANGIVPYFSHLAIDMQVAWGVLGLGIVLIVVGLFLL